MKYIYVIVFVFLLFACDNHVEEQYYSSGEIKQKCIIIDETEKKCTIFYKSGSVKEIFTKINDTVQGNASGFLQDNVTTFKINYKDGLRNYAMTYVSNKLYDKIYYQNGIPKFRVSFPESVHLAKVNIEGKVIGPDTVISGKDVQIINTSFFINREKTKLTGQLFLKNGKITALSDYITIEQNKDTLNFNEEYKAEFNLYLRDFDKAKLIFGEYDDSLKIIKPKNPDTVYITEDKPYIHKMKTVKPGLNRLTGVFIGYNDSLCSETRPFYKVFYVKEK